MEPWLWAVIPLVVMILLLMACMPKRRCVECNEPLPRVRFPTSVRQLLRGGWTCPACGCEMDRQGRKIEPQ